jgi:hypothetical protein
LDLVVYTPEEFEEMQRNNHFIRSEITKKVKKSIMPLDPKWAAFAQNDLFSAEVLLKEEV